MKNTEAYKHVFSFQRNFPPARELLFLIHKALFCIFYYMLINYGRRSSAFRLVQLGRVALYDIEAYSKSGGCLENKLSLIFPFFFFLPLFLCFLSPASPPPAIHLSIHTFRNFWRFTCPKPFSVRGWKHQILRCKYTIEINEFRQRAQVLGEGGVPWWKW